MPARVVVCRRESAVAAGEDSEVASARVVVCRTSEQALGVAAAPLDELDVRCTRRRVSNCR